MTNENHLIELPNGEDPPTLVAGSTSLLTDMLDEDKGLPDIVPALEQFATITGKLVALANSAWSAPVSEITNLSDACSRLGMQVVRSITIGLAVSRPFDTKACPSFDCNRYWSTSLLSAEIAGSLADKFGHEGPTARIAALLRSIGLLWFADKHPEQTEQVLAQCARDANLDLSAELTRVFGFDHITAGRALLSAWDMPPVLVEALSPSTSGSDTDSAPAGLSELANNSSMLASHIYQGSCEFDWDSCDLDTDAYAPAYEQGNQGLERVRAIASTLFPG